MLFSPLVGQKSLMRKGLGWFKWLNQLRRKEIVWRYSKVAICSVIFIIVLFFSLLILFRQGVKNEAEAYMLKRLSLLKWQEKATKLASEATNGEMVEKQYMVSSLEENLKLERQFWLQHIPYHRDVLVHSICYCETFCIMSGRRFRKIKRH